MRHSSGRLRSHSWHPKAVHGPWDLITANHALLCSFLTLQFGDPDLFPIPVTNV